jgi:hypothetical protein
MHIVYFLPLSPQKPHRGAFVVGNAGLVVADRDLQRVKTSGKQKDVRAVEVSRGDEFGSARAQYDGSGITAAAKAAER